jgi:chemotaxis protein CheZ
MSSVEIDKLDRLVAFLRKKRGEHASIAEVTALAEVMADSLHDFYRLLHTSVHTELKDIVDYIARMRAEIAALRPNDLYRVYIPAAGNELAAVVQVTEAATHSIMERVEAIMSTEISDLATYRAFVNARLIAIIEACSFQDITGQRIAKVAKMLGQIEERIARFAMATHISDTEGLKSEHEGATVGRKHRLMLNGPAAKGEGNGQHDVDFLFDARKPTVTQTEIDKLFARTGDLPREPPDQSRGPSAGLRE